MSKVNKINSESTNMVLIYRAFNTAPFENYVIIANLSPAVSMVSFRDLGSTISGGPVSSVHWSALLRNQNESGHMVCLARSSPVLTTKAQANTIIANKPSKNIG